MRFAELTCDRYRDNLPLLQAKLGLLASINVASAKGDESPLSSFADPWKNISATQLLKLSDLIVNIERFESPRSHPEESHVLTQCELKFILEVYLRSGGTIATRVDLDNFHRSRDRYLSSALSEGHCDQDELSDFFLFRGARVLTPVSGEAPINVMIDRTVRGRCQTGMKTQDSSLGRVREQYCKAALTRPEAVRRTVARQVLAAFSEIGMRRNYAPRRSLKDYLVITEDLDGDGVGEIVVENFSKNKISHFASALQDLWHEPGSSSGDKALLKRVSQSLNRALQSRQLSYKGGFKISLGGDSLPVQSIPPENRPLTTAPERREMKSLIKSLVLRHVNQGRTSFYFSAFQMFEEGVSPFLYSTRSLPKALGYAGLKPDGSTRQSSNKRGGWLYVFKVKRSDLYSVRKLDSGIPPNLETNWIDESSFTDEPLDKGAGRFSEPTPSELDSLLYVNIAE